MAGDDVLQDLDHSLGALLKAELPSSITSGAAITFAAPDLNFPPPYVQLPAIDLFLFAIEENHDLRTFLPDETRQPDGTVLRTARQPKIDCHYMISAFPAKGAPNPDDDEHRMLGETMRVLMRHRRLPEPVLQGAMIGQQTQVRSIALTTAVSTGLKPGIEIWQALQARPRVTIHYWLTISVDLQLPALVELPASGIQIQSGP